MKRIYALSPSVVKAWGTSFSLHAIFAVFLLWGADWFATSANGVQSLRVVEISLPGVEEGNPAPPLRSMPERRSGKASNASQIKQADAGDGFRQKNNARGALESYLDELRRRIAEKKVYPPLSRQMRESGEVQLAFRIHQDGRLQDTRVEKTSGFSRLDAAARRLVEDLGRIDPLPASYQGQSLPVSLPIRYVLE